MKKIFAILLVLGIAVTAAFAADTEFPTGKWLDKNWDAVWEFGIGNSLKLWNTNGDLIYDFSKDKITDLKLLPSQEGLVLSFTCPETHRSYKFVKPITLSADLELEIDRDWTDEEYSTTITLQK